MEYGIAKHMPGRVLVDNFKKRCDTRLAGNAGMVLGEIGGAFKYVMGEDGILVTPINVSTARKVLLGKIPKGKGAAAAAVHAVVQRMSPPWGEGSDEGDAWVIGNAARSLLGLTAATVA